MTGLGFNTSFRVDFGATVALLPSNGSWILFICYRTVPYSSLNGESWLGAKVWYLSLGSLSEASDIYMVLRVHSLWSLGLRVTLIFCSGLQIVSLHWDLILKARVAIKAITHWSPEACQCFDFTLLDTCATSSPKNSYFFDFPSG